MLENKIINYLSYLGDTDYITEVVTSPGVIEILTKLIHDKNPENVGDACLFITDLVLGCSRNDTCKQLWQNKIKSAIIPELEKLVFSQNHFICKQVIYTLGKIGSYESIPVLLNAFDELRDRNPILLPRLVGELFWLGVDNRFQILDNMITSHQYTTRWAVLSILQEFIYNSPNENDKIFLMKYKLCEHLRYDSQPLIKAEAEYEYLLLELNLRKYQENMSNSQYKKFRKELNKIKPSLCFSDVECQFSNYLYKQNKFTYSLEDLEAFIASKI